MKARAGEYHQKEINVALASFTSQFQSNTENTKMVQASLVSERPGLAPIKGRKKGEFRDWTRSKSITEQQCFQLSEIKFILFLDFRSDIIGHIPTYKERLESWLTSVNFQGKLWKPCYSDARDGWDSNVFHKNCDGKGPTLTIARFNNTIFGGFADHSWGSMSLKIRMRPSC